MMSKTSPATKNPNGIGLRSPKIPSAILDRRASCKLMELPPLKVASRHREEMEQYLYRFGAISSSRVQLADARSAGQPMGLQPASASSCSSVLLYSDTSCL